MINYTIRGGGWGSAPRYCHATYRAAFLHDDGPWYRYYASSFRIVTH